MHRSIFYATLVSVGILGASAVVLAGVPKGKETLELNTIDGDKGAVKFEHAKHMERKGDGGAATTCKTCHHTLKAADGAGEEVKGCGSCHAKVGEAAKDIGGKKAPVLGEKGGDKVTPKSVLFHKSCVDGCHKKVEKTVNKKIAVCKTCHAK